MLRQSFDGSGDTQERVLIARPPRGDHHVGDHRTPRGHRAGLVEDDGGDLAGPLQGLTAFDQDSERGRTATGDHHGRRNGQPHGAGARDDQHGDRRRKAAHQWRRPGQRPPGDEGHHGQRDHDGDEHGADPVGQRLNRRAGRLRVPHQPDDARQHAGLAKRRRAVSQGTGAVDRAADDAVAGTLGHRHRLAGQHRLVHGAGALDDLAVDGNPLTGPHDDHVAFAHVADWDVELDALSTHACRTRLQARERSQRTRRASDGPGLERTARQHEGDDQNHRFVVHVGGDAARGEERRRDRGDERVEERGAGADGDQGVHVGRAVSQAHPRAPVELAARPAHRRQRQGEQDPRDRRQPWAGVSRMARVHARHQRHGGRHRQGARGATGDGLHAQSAVLVCLCLVPGFLLGHDVDDRRRQLRLVASVADRLDQLLGSDH